LGSQVDTQQGVIALWVWDDKEWALNGRREFPPSQVGAKPGVIRVAPECQGTGDDSLLSTNMGGNSIRNESSARVPAGRSKGKGKRKGSPFFE